MMGTTTTPRYAIGERDPTVYLSKFYHDGFYPDDLQNLVVSYKYPGNHYKVFNESKNRPTQDKNSRYFHRGFSSLLPTYSGPLRGGKAGLFFVGPGAQGVPEVSQRMAREGPKRASGGPLRGPSRGSVEPQNGIGVMS
jgi:hypothetical protein